MDHIGTIIIAVVASSGFWALLQKLIESRATKQSVEREALLALLHDKIYDKCEGIINTGSVSTDEYENLEYLYTPYEKMGGNGTCHRLMEEVQKLPIR